MKAERLQPYLDALTEKGITIGGVGLSAAGAPGLDLKENGDVADEINLLDKGIHRRPKTPMALTVLLLAVLIASGLFWMVSPLQIEEKKTEMIDREIAARKDEVKKVEALKKELDGLEKEIAAINAFRTARPIDYQPAQGNDPDSAEQCLAFPGTIYRVHGRNRRLCRLGNGHIAAIGEFPVFRKSRVCIPHHEGCPFECGPLHHKDGNRRITGRKGKK